MNQFLSVPAEDISDKEQEDRSGNNMPSHAGECIVVKATDDQC
jgi:hypothetical protein